jgi:hypothetical protein
MPGSIPELEEIGPQLEGEGLRSLREEVRRLLGRRNPSFPGHKLACFKLIVQVPNLSVF